MAFHSFSHPILGDFSSVFYLRNDIKILHPPKTLSLDPQNNPFLNAFPILTQGIRCGPGCFCQLVIIVRSSFPKSDQSEMTPSEAQRGAKRRGLPDVDRPRETQGNKNVSVENRSVGAPLFTITTGGPKAPVGHNPPRIATRG